jgi:hypothetical protein
MTIEPESAAGVEDFELKVEVRWVHPADFACEVGFAIIESPKKKHFQRYVDYLDYRENNKS